MRLALISLDQLWLDKSANFEHCIELVSNASKYECDLFIFPEMTLTGYSFDDDYVVENIQESITLDLFRSLAKDFNTNIIFGAALIRPDSKIPENTICLADSNGNCSSVYSKIHLFSHAGEDKFFKPGLQPYILNIAGIEFLTSICYDLRFPEIYSAFADKVHASIVIANWPAVRIDHWRSLLIGRAIENQIYMIGVNRIGMDGRNIEYEKSSMLITPEGKVATPIVSNREIDIYEIGANFVEDYRSSFSTIKDKRPDIYKRIHDDKISR